MDQDLFGHELEWQRHSRCHRMGTELFFPQDGESPHQRSKRERIAKQLCACCAVADRCRTYALEISEPHGIWGGLSAHERRSKLGAASHLEGIRSPCCACDDRHQTDTTATAPTSKNSERRRRHPHRSPADALRRRRR
ncbi:MAG: WhiB family transcriptional regulator [Rhodococcus sp. (in: high G+C Gram-positive bacteria)]|nr:MAG: WhiB family transcriptional regulator [Rhodococcus sp. (in: high G+C Gram-positive bacteria)]